MIKWERDTKQYSNAWNGRLGRWICFCLNWNSCKPKGSDKPDWVLRCSLPGIKSNLGEFTEKAGKKYVETVLKYWLERTGQMHLGDKE